MKVLIAYPDKKLSDNPFVRTLKKGLENAGCDVNWGLNEFWSYTDKYDIIHIQWPDSLFLNWSPSDLEVLFLERHIEAVKKHSKIVYTRHNESPHYAQNPNKLKVYEIIERNADAIVHLGSYGIAALKEKIKSDNIGHFVIPHHIYENEYNYNVLTQSEARKKLNISQNKFVILTFGAYRDAEEVHMVLDEFKKMESKHKYLLAPRLREILISEATKRFSLRWIKNKALLLKFKLQGINMGSDFVTDDFVADYFSAADVVLIQRKNILNSGNVPLAFLFKKPVVGANAGNLGELLIKTNNIVFNPSINGDLCKVLSRIDKIAASNIGIKNYNYALQEMNIRNIASLYMNVYNTLFKNQNTV